MSINAMGKNEIANNRKVLSDFKNDTDLLNFKDDRAVSANSKAYESVRNIQDDKLLASLENISDEHYFKELFNSVEC